MGTLLRWGWFESTWGVWWVALSLASAAFGLMLAHACPTRWKCMGCGLLRGGGLHKVFSFYPPTVVVFS